MASSTSSQFLNPSGMPRTVTGLAMLETTPNGLVSTKTFETTSNETSHSPELIPVEAASVAGALGFFIILCGGFGNLLLLTAVLKVRSLRTTTNFFIASQAVNDLLLLLISGTLTMSAYISRRWPYNNTVCLIILFFNSAGHTVGCVHTVMVAVSRYMFISRPFVYLKLGRRRNLWVSICLMYAIPYCFMIGFLMSVLTSVETQLVFDLRAMACIFTHRENSVMNTYAVVSILTAVMLYVYLRSYCVIKHSLLAVRPLASNPHPHPEPRPKLHTPLLLGRERIFINSVAITFCVFVVTYLPSPVTFDIDREWALPWMLRVLVVVLSWTSAGTNWLVFGLMNYPFRRAFRLIIQWTIQCKAFRPEAVPSVPPPPRRPKQVPVVFFIKRAWNKRTRFFQQTNRTNSTWKLPHIH